MSVINQMLRDLDSRAASDRERAGLPPRLRTLPPGERVRRQDLRLLVIGMGAGAILMAVILLLIFLWPANTQLATPGSAAPVPFAAPPALSVPPVVSAVAGAVSPAPTFASVDAPAAPAAVTEMKFSTIVKPPPKPVVVQSAVPAPAKLAPQGKSATTFPAPKASIEEAQIDKRTKGMAGHEQADAEYRKAMQAVKRGDNEGAIPFFKLALELEPDLVRARQGYLSVLVSTKRWETARQVAEQGLALDPTQTSWANIVARLQFEQGDVSGAVQTLERFAVHAANDADFQGLFAYLLQKQQRPAEAAERFRLALGVRPSEGRWWFGLGLSLEQTGNTAGAREAYSKAKAVGNLPPDMTLVVEQKLK